MVLQDVVTYLLMVRLLKQHHLLNHPTFAMYFKTLTLSQSAFG